MIDLLMTADNDLALDGDLTVVDGAKSLAQRVKNALIMHRGQWFLDLRAGMPWQSTLAAPANAGIVDAVIRAEAQKVAGVARISSLSSVVSGDYYRGSLTVEGRDAARAVVSFEV